MNRGNCERKKRIGTLTLIRDTSFGELSSARSLVKNYNFALCLWSIKKDIPSNHNCVSCPQDKIQPMASSLKEWWQKSNKGMSIN